MRKSGRSRAPVKGTRVTRATLAARSAAQLILILYLGARAGQAFHVCRQDMATFPGLFAQNLLRFWEWTPSPDVLMFALAGALVWAWIAVQTFQSEGTFRRGAEHGTARWDNPRKLSRRWQSAGMRRAPDGTLLEDPNIILSRHMRLGLKGGADMRKNRNLLVIGGSGTRKSTGLVMPNIMQCNSSFLVTDPSGELYRGLGGLLEQRGYCVRCLNLVDMQRSHGTNPFAYLSKPEDVAMLATAFIENTRTTDRPGGDPFWDDAMRLLLTALIAYIWEFEPPEQQNFSTLTEMVRAGRIEKDAMDATSALDNVFADLSVKHPGSLAATSYALYVCAPPKTRASVVITLAARLGVFNIPAAAALTRRDELELNRLGERRQAVFCIIPQADTTFNFLVGLVYTSLISALYRRGEEEARSGGSTALQVPVQILMDEFANVGRPMNFGQVLATCRKYGISVGIFLQNMTQLKALYPDEWESIAGNCDSLVYLGGNEAFTWRYLSEALDQETIHVRSKGRSGSGSSENDQVTGRSLLTAGEVRSLDDDKCIVLVRGEYGVMDDKYDITQHPNFRHIAMGGALPYGQQFLRMREEDLEVLRTMQQQALRDMPPQRQDIST
ncbi:MAG: type IV secretory system conjugative DNA transfer family protein [Clostridia bacterium]|nr:type IV secretory system conjugative DNA transfer family protein [Clostridia bacterium]